MKCNQGYRKVKQCITHLSHNLAKHMRRVCSVLLCVSMVAGSLPAAAFSVFAAGDDESEYVYEIDSLTLMEAVSKAVTEGNELEKELQFLGDAAEDYE